MLDRVVAPTVRWLNRVAEPIFYHPSGMRGAVGGRLLAMIWGRNAVNLLRYLRVPDDAIMLEVGCGPGVGLAEAARLAPSGHVVGLDPSPTMIGQARARNARPLAAGRAAVVRGVAANLPFPAHHFNIAVSLSSLPFWDDPQAGLTEIHRVLTPGGRVGIGINPPPAWPTNAPGLQRMLTAAGFEKVRVVRLPTITIAVVAEKPA